MTHGTSGSGTGVTLGHWFSFSLPACHEGTGHAPPLKLLGSCINLSLFPSLAPPVPGHHGPRCANSVVPLVKPMHCETPVSIAICLLEGPWSAGTSEDRNLTVIL